MVKKQQLGRAGGGGYHRRSPLHLLSKSLSVCTIDYRQLLAKTSYFEIRKKPQLISADFGQEFCILTKMKHVPHCFQLNFDRRVQFLH